MLYVDRRLQSDANVNLQLSRGRPPEEEEGGGHAAPVTTYY